jgi:predicted RNA-binding protein with RPS1 domain
MTWVDALALRNDEKVVEAWHGIREIIGGTFDVTLHEGQKNRRRLTVREHKEGLLVLTTQRLLFLEGLEPDGKRLGESVKVSLIDVDIEKLGFEKAPLRPIDEVPGYETNVFRLKRVRKKKEFNKFKALIEEYINKRNQQLKEETKKVVKFKIN